MSKAARKSAKTSMWHLPTPERSSRLFLVEVLGEFAPKFRVVRAVGVEVANHETTIASSGIERLRPFTDLFARRRAGFDREDELGVVSERRRSLISASRSATNLCTSSVIVFT
jgi:hypothetical protein